MFSSKDIFQTASTGGYKISRSVRLRASASAYLNRTQTSGNQQTWTWSGWIKRGTLSSAYNIFGYLNYSAGVFNNQQYLGFDSNNCLQFWYYPSGANTQLTTTQVFRDPSAWYHIVCVWDTTQATAANRVRLYVNGSQITSFSTANYPSQNTNGYINTNALGVGIGQVVPSTGNGGPYYDGYLTEINFIDGQQLTPTSFGAYNTTTGVWQPKKYGGTYGTNGFYLNFSDPTSTTTIGYDYSGNGNNWTSNNISVTSGVTYDSMIDTPTPYADGGNGRGNYAVWNPAIPSQMAGGSATISNANLTVGDAGTSYGVAAQGSVAVTSGKWYWEVTASTVGGSYGGCGIRLSTLQGTDGAGYFYYSDGTKSTSIYGGGSAYGASYTSGDVLGIALDMNAGTLIFYKNGTSQGTAYTGLTGSFSACVGDGQNATAYVWNINFGQRPFAYTPPSGYVAVNTQNLPDSTITNGAQYMAATTYTSTGTTQTINNGSNTTIGTTFQPDFVWQKARSNVQDNYLIDSVRGASKYVISNSNVAEATAAQFLTSFNSNGVTFGTSNLPNGWTNVAWQWKETPTAGFDIVPYTFSSTGIATISHNLGVVPKMILAKRLNATEQWLVYQASGTTQSQYLGLNTTAGVASSANLWGSSAFTSSQFYFNATNGYQYIFYVFADVAGYSSFGSYTGNGSTDGPFVFTGMRVRYLMVKRTDTTGDWYVFDTSRDPYNATTYGLIPNSSGTDTSYTGWGDLLSNGFKIRRTDGAWNASGGTYIYAAFAENPFKNALAR